MQAQPKLVRLRRGSPLQAPSPRPQSSADTGDATRVPGPPVPKMPRPTKRRRTHPDGSIPFSAASAPPYNLLSNFHGGAELHFMAARFEHAALQRLLRETFAACSEAHFRRFFAALHPAGNAATYIAGGVPARGVLGRLAGTAAVGSGRSAAARMCVLRRLAGVPEGDVVRTNTARILSEAGLAEDAEKGAREDAIQKHNDRLMRECLRAKFRQGHCSDDGVEFRELLLGTGDRRLREAVRGRGGRWSAKGDDDGVLGRMLMQLRDEIRDGIRGEEEEEEEEEEDRPSSSSEASDEAVVR